MILDLTHTIRAEMPLYPGTPAPSFTPCSTLIRDGFRETLVQFASHTGTHMDAPAHLLRDGTTLDVLPVSQFCGRAAVVDVSGLPEGGVITAEFLRARNGEVLSADFVLFYTGWEKKWGCPEYLRGFPVPDEDAARYLVSCGLKGVGTDALSVDPVEDKTARAHRILLGGGLVVLENLCLRRLAGRSDVMLFALPLKLEKADGAPVRAVAEFRDFPKEEDV